MPEDEKEDDFDLGEFDWGNDDYIPIDPVDEALDMITRLFWVQIQYDQKKKLQELERKEKGEEEKQKKEKQN